MIEIGDKFQDGVDTVFEVIDLHDNFDEVEDNVRVRYKSPYRRNWSKAWLSAEWMEDKLVKKTKYYNDKEKLDV